METVSRDDLNVTGHTIRKYMQPGEQDVLIALISTIKPRTMIEIGVNEGLTAKAVLEHVPSIEHYYGVDVNSSYEFEIPAQRIERPGIPGVMVLDDPRFHLIIRGDLMPHEADVVFIDGDHGKNAVLADSIWAEAVVTHGGLIIWHDYGNPTVEVTHVLNKLDTHGRELHHVEGTWLVFEQR